MSLRDIGAIIVVANISAVGVLKKSREALMLLLKSEIMSKETTTSEPLREQKYMNLEVISFSDGKRAVAKAANFILKWHYVSAKTKGLNLTKCDMNQETEFGRV